MVAGPAMGKYTAAVYDRLILPAQAFLTLGQERRLHGSGLPVPSGIPIQMVIDTGAGRSSLSPFVLNQLRPMDRGDVLLTTGLGSVRTTLFWVRLEFPGTNLEPVSNLAVAEVRMPSNLPGFHGVLGRDVLSRWESFHWQGRRGRLTIRDVPGWFSRFWR